MDAFIINGGAPLKGGVKADGSKNAALPALLASLLTDGECAVSGMPPLRDIRTALRLLEALGKKTVYENGAARILCGGKTATDAPYDLVKQMRASALAAGPLLARFGRARVPLPGGCAIGLRPLDIHIKAFERLGASVRTRDGCLELSARKLEGARIKFPFPSVGATENAMLCAALTPGLTVLENPALEPEIDDLISCLNGMGAFIRREKNGDISINGVKKLRGANHAVMPDRVVAGTCLVAAAATGGEIDISDCRPRDMRALLAALAKSGARIKTGANSVSLKAPKSRPLPAGITTRPHPGFPTDLQPQWMAYMCRAAGCCRVRETIFENRFMHAAELARMGADIRVKGNCAAISGAARLSGAEVMSSDLRGGAALAVAALSAGGRSVVQRVYHIDRGYFRLENTFSALGADIRRVNL
ncbi:MAG: UDP-N-acetylglucosamine 1-carboxyvinyltransferase [Elusimicrobiales bacterium]